MIRRRLWLAIPGMAMFVASMALGLWQLAGGPRTFPWSSLLALVGTCTLLIWQHLEARDIRRRRSLLDTHRMFNIRAGLPLPPEDER